MQMRACGFLIITQQQVEAAVEEDWLSLLSSNFAYVDERLQPLEAVTASVDTVCCSKFGEDHGLG